MANNPGRAIFLGRASLFKSMREVVKGLLYPTQSIQKRGVLSQTDQILNELVNSFSRFAGNQQTAFDNGAGRSISNTGGNAMQLQVERAITQVLGRGLGGPMGTSTLINALNATFPVNSDGTVMSMPQRGAISLYNTSNITSNGSYSSGINPYSNSVLGSLVGQLSAKQAALYREASIVAGDALKILAGLQTFMPEADTEEVEALRALVQSEINALVEEFGRVDEPRVTRVEAYLDALTINLIEFGRRGLLDNPRLVTTIDDETQTTGFQLLKNYTTILRTIWNKFNTSVRVTPTYSLSEQVERANVMLPVLAQSNIDFQAALDSVSFTESEQRSRAAYFTNLDGTQITLPNPALNIIYNLGFQLPDITIRDLADWIDRFANNEGSVILADSGQFGLEFVLNESDTLFWTIAPIIGMLEFLDTTNSINRAMLRQILTNERVRWSLDNLLEQLKALADLAA